MGSGIFGIFIQISKRSVWANTFADGFSVLLNYVSREKLKGKKRTLFNWPALKLFCQRGQVLASDMPTITGWIITGWSWIIASWSTATSWSPPLWLFTLFSLKGYVDQGWVTGWELGGGGMGRDLSTSRDMSTGRGLSRGWVQLCSVVSSPLWLHTPEGWYISYQHCDSESHMHCVGGKVKCVPNSSYQPPFNRYH